MSKEEIAAIVNAITSLMTVLRDADPHDKAEIYGQLGLRDALRRAQDLARLLSRRRRRRLYGQRAYSA